FNCGLRHSIPVGPKPIRLNLNVDIPSMPITSDGKTPNFEPFLGPIVDAVTKAVKRARRAAAGGSRADKGPSQKDAILGCLDQAIAKAGGGEYRYGERQLFYASR